MRSVSVFFRCFVLFSVALLFLTGCGSTSDRKGSSASKGIFSSKTEHRQTLYSFPIPEASGTSVGGNDVVTMDYSHTENGYFMVNYTGSADKVKLQITTPDGTVYTYPVFTGGYAVFPLSGGNGSYHIDLLEHAYDDMYALSCSEDISVTLKDEFQPFLYPNQYVSYDADGNAVKLGEELSEESTGDLNYVEKIYDYVITTITYDQELAANAPIDYIPDADNTLSSKKGICFDYASLMTALLRSQGIPTRLEVGYSGEAYHAWISVYLKEIGWVDNIIEFDGKNWSLIDPTLAASNNKKAVKKYIGDGNNYIVKYIY